jgi:hypothetical protein
MDLLQLRTVGAVIRIAPALVGRIRRRTKPRRLVLPVVDTPAPEARTTVPAIDRPAIRTRIERTRAIPMRSVPGLIETPEQLDDRLDWSVRTPQPPDALTLMRAFARRAVTVNVANP